MKSPMETFDPTLTSGDSELTDCRNFWLTNVMGVYTASSRSSGALTRDTQATT